MRNLANVKYTASIIYLVGIFYFQYIILINNSIFKYYYKIYSSILFLKKNEISLQLNSKLNLSNKLSRLNK